SHEPGNFVLIDGEPRSRAELDLFQWIPCDANNLYRKKLLATVVGAVSKIRSRIQFMGAKKVMRMRTVEFFPGCACRIAVLVVEKATFGGLDKKLVRPIAVWRKISVKPPEAHLRRQQVVGA